jgi:hypothetical protein
MERIATLLAYSSQMAVEIGQQPMDASLADLPRLQILAETIQQVGDESQQRLALQAVGMSLGQVLATQDGDYDWWMIDDENGRDPCLRYLQTDLLVFPQTLISRRVEEGEAVRVEELYQQIIAQLNNVVEKQLNA